MFYDIAIFFQLLVAHASGIHPVSLAIFCVGLDVNNAFLETTAISTISWVVIMGVPPVKIGNRTVIFIDPYLLWLSVNAKADIDIRTPRIIRKVGMASVRISLHMDDLAFQTANLSLTARYGSIKVFSKNTIS